MFFFIYHLILSSTLPPILFNISIHDLSLSPLFNFCFFSFFFLFRHSHFQIPCSLLLLHLCHPHNILCKKNIHAFFHCLFFILTFPPRYVDFVYRISKDQSFYSPVSLSFLLIIEGVQKVLEQELY